MKNRATILILGTAQFVMVLDTTVMNVSITQVVDDLDTTVPAVQLAITAYALVMAAFMLTGAKLGDMKGRRRIFAIGLGVYGTGSLITSLSPNIGVLLFGWSFVEGIGATLVIPAIASLTAANYTGKERALAYGLLGGIAGAAVAAGPLIGGFVTSALTWRVVFASETVVVVGILLFGIRHVKDSPAVSRERIDVPGVALSALGLGLVVLGVLKSSSWGLVRPTGALTINGTEITPFGLSVVPFIIAAGLIVLMAFRRVEQHQARVGRSAHLSPNLLRENQQLRSGLSMFVAGYLIMAGSFFVLPLYLQLVRGKDAFETGVAILPVSVAMMIAALVGARIADRVSPRRIVRIGLAVLFVGLIALMSTISPSLTTPLFSISLALFGAGVGLVVSQLGNVVMSSIDESRSSEAGGLQGAAQSLGSALGTALIGAVLLAGLTSGFHDLVRADDSIPPNVQDQIVDGSQDGVPMISEAQAESIAKKAGLSADQTKNVVDHYSDAQIEALKKALLAAAAFSLVALWFAGDLPGAPLAAQESEAAGRRPGTPIRWPKRRKKAPAPPPICRYVTSNLGEAVKGHVIEVDASPVVERRGDGKVKLHQPSLAGIGAAGGALWGGLIVLLFFAPLLGMAVRPPLRGRRGAQRPRRAVPEASRRRAGAGQGGADRARARCRPTRRARVRSPARSDSLICGVRIPSAWPRYCASASASDSALRGTPKPRRKGERGFLTRTSRRCARGRPGATPPSLEGIGLACREVQRKREGPDMPPLAVSTGLGIGFGVLYILLLLTLGILSLRKGHWVMFIIGIVFPLFWLIGALMPPRQPG